MVIRKTKFNKVSLLFKPSDMKNKVSTADMRLNEMLCNRSAY